MRLLGHGPLALGPALGAGGALRLRGGPDGFDGGRFGSAVPFRPQPLLGLRPVPLRATLGPALTLPGGVGPGPNLLPSRFHPMSPRSLYVSAWHASERRRAGGRSGSM